MLPAITTVDHSEVWTRNNCLRPDIGKVILGSATVCSMTIFCQKFHTQHSQKPCFTNRVYEDKSLKEQVLDLSISRPTWCDNNWISFSLDNIIGHHLQAVLHLRSVVGLQSAGLLNQLEHFAEVVLDGCHGGDDGWRPEAVCDEREVSESPLYGRLENRVRSCVSDWWSVLVQEINELFDDLSGSHKTFQISKTILEVASSFESCK